MDIIISNEKSIGEVQKEFREAFPFLKIEFFKKGKANHKSTGEIISADTPFGMIRQDDSPGHINIDPQRTVGDVEMDFFDHQGLLAQIFRRSGKLWIATTLTDCWSLHRQNLAGEQMS